MNEEKALSLLSDSGLRITRPRRLLLKAVLAMQTHFSAGDVLAALTKMEKGHGFDLVTLYRNLPVFEEVGIICRADFSDDMIRYTLAHAGHDHHHHHIVCRSCQKVAPVDLCLLEVQQKALVKMGFKDVRHRLEFSGICRACS
ncbi:MAG: transcriptional repressor [Bdellovibrionales bacterium]|nr:transcriptional repressor [Bdellovibrionales bacterium]